MTAPKKKPSTDKEKKAKNPSRGPVKSSKKPTSSKKSFSKKREKKPEAMPTDMLVGIIHLHPKGFGFVTPKDSTLLKEDVFIPKHHTQNAMDGDEVKISFGPSSKSDKGPEGAVVEVLKRGRHTLVGVVCDDTPGHLVAYCPMLGEKKMVQIQEDPTITLSVGDRLVVEVLSWGEYPYLIQAKPLHVIGSILDPSIDIEVAIKEYEIKEGFPKNCIEEAKKYSPDPSPQDLKDRTDLTHLETFTIDPDTAKDYDDALSVSQSKNGNYHLVVHIADVSHYVPKGSELDLEAKERALSAYFPGRCVPMLPEELSNGLCSLKEQVIRLTISVFVEFNSNGDMLNYDIKRSYIKSQKRLTYKQAKLILDGKLDSPHAPTLKKMVELCHLLQKKRKERGSVEFFLPEIVLLVDANGVPTGHEIVEYDITHQLVEEFMLKANELVAHKLLSRKVDAIFRVHDAPSEQDLTDFFNLARSMGFQVPAKPTNEDLQKLFEDAKQTPFLHQLSIAFIRSMKLAVYSEANIGHYGLSLEHYCHFTSPIRRYTDLVVHRLLFEKPVDKEELKAVAKTCSDKERVHFKAEQSVIELKKLRLIEKTFQENPEATYQAIISKVKPFGIYFEVEPLMLEGFIHVSELGNEYFIFDDVAKKFTGDGSGRSFKSGDSITVTLEDLDILMQKTTWVMSNTSKRQRSSDSPRKKRRHK